MQALGWRLQWPGGHNRGRSTVRGCGGGGGGGDGGSGCADIVGGGCGDKDTGGAADWGTGGDRTILSGFVLPANHAEYPVRELAKESGKRQEAAEKVVEAAEAEAAEGFTAEAEASTASIVELAADGAWWEVSGRW